MALVALQAGLAWDDLRHMKVTHLRQVIWEWEDMNGAKSTEVVEATDAEVMALTRL